MKQRLGIAQAVLNDPDVLVLDEPTAGLDPKERVRFRNLIAGFATDKIVLLSTHIVSDVEYIADSILMMRAGSFIMQGSPSEVVRGVEGMVWEARVPVRKADELASRVPVVNVHHDGDGMATVRFLSSEPYVAELSAVPVAPTLEDLYLHVFDESGAEHTGAAVPVTAVEGSAAPVAAGSFWRWAPCVALSSSSSRRCSPVASRLWRTWACCSC